tara:strand:+ start:6952 stop:7554 length:603 start_codon:yes stop_codon:yes gene_type:complete
MAVAPLFVVDLDTLRLELRLQGLKTGSEGESIFVRATSAARVYLYQRLGINLATTLVAVTEVENPTTAEDIRRKAASLAEVEIVRCDLLDLMPIMVGDASGDAQQVYNDEGVWRSATPEERVEALGRCRARIEELIELMLSEDELGDDLTIRVFNGQRAVNDERFPGGTSLPAIGKFKGNFEESYHAGNDEVSVRFELES